MHEATAGTPRATQRGVREPDDRRGARVHRTAAGEDDEQEEDLRGRLEEWRGIPALVSCLCASVLI